MGIILTPVQQAWLEARVADGEFASVDEAVSQILDERMVRDDDLDWAIPLVEESRAAVARGEVLTLEEHRARNAALLARLRG
jgi:antitoxin ParD1/3/4